MVRFLITSFLLIACFVFVGEVRAEGTCLDWTSKIKNVDLENYDALSNILQECKDYFSGEGLFLSWARVQEQSYCYNSANGEDYCCPASPSICCSWRNDGCGLGSCGTKDMQQTCGPDECTRGVCVLGETQCYTSHPNCTNYSGSPQTASLITPSLVSPTNNGNLFASEQTLKWDGSGSFYQYKVDCISVSDKSNDCKDMAGENVIPLTVISSKSAHLNLLCLGEYRWWVKSCGDRNCNESTQFAGPWNFSLVEKSVNIPIKSIVPCGRRYDDPDTSWNEREACQLKHIFLLFKNILDFILWRLSLIILGLLIIVVGAMSYFSLGSPQTMARTRSILKTTMVGFLVIFIVWLIVDIILIIIGYQVSIFGKWWQISL